MGEMLPAAAGDDDPAAPNLGGQETPSAIAWHSSGDIIRWRNQARTLLEWKESYGPSLSSASEAQTSDPD
jgi:hypothetical protein